MSSNTRSFLDICSLADLSWLILFSYLSSSLLSSSSFSFSSLLISSLFSLSYLSPSDSRALNESLAIRYYLTRSCIKCSVFPFNCLDSSASDPFSYSRLYISCSLSLIVLLNSLTCLLYPSVYLLCFFSLFIKALAKVLIS